MNNSIVNVVERPAFGDPTQGDASLSDWFKLLRRRRHIILASLIFFLTVVTIKAVLTTPRYLATGEIQIQKDSSSLGPLNSLADSSSAAAGSSDTLDYNVTLQTQVNILGSDSIALEVIKDLNLESTADFFPKRERSQYAVPAWVFFWRKPVEPLSVPLEDAPDRRYVTLKIFSKNLKIEPIAGTRLINVSYANPDPKLAAEVVNRVVSAFTDYNFQMRVTATSQTSKWLVGQLSDLKKRTEDLQVKAIKLQRSTGMFGNDEEHNIVLARLKDLNDALSISESNRILKEAIYREVEKGGAEAVSGLSGNGGLSGGAASANSLALLQSLRGQQAVIGTELAQNRAKYGSSHPKLAQLEAQYADTEKAIQAEVNRIAQRAKSDFQIAARSEGAAREAFEQQKQTANELNDKATDYALAKEEADKSRELYEGLLGKLKEADVLESLRASNITVVSPGRVPSSNKPKSPNLLLYYAAGVAGGLFWGIVAAVIVDLTDRAYRSLPEMERLLGATIVGVIPVFRRKNRNPLAWPKAFHERPKKLLDTQAGDLRSDIQVIDHPHSAFAESLRSLRTILALSRSGNPPQVVLVTSSVPGEGKTTLSLNLAAILGQQGSRVLLVNGDLRRRGLDNYLGIPDSEGLSAALTGGLNEPQRHYLPNVPNVWVVVGGDAPPFPSELLGSDMMRELVLHWRNQYDYIIIDSPPILPVTDAILLSQLADASLLVVRHGATARQAVERGYKSLGQQLPDNTVLALTLNAVPEESVDYGEYYGYRSFSSMSQ